MTEEFITPGGPSAPVWAFLTTITVLAVTNVFQLFQAKLAAKLVAEKATQTAVTAVEVAADTARAVADTTSISNGLAGNIDRKLDIIYTVVQDIEGRFAEHLSWHLNQEKGHHHARAAQPEERPDQQGNPRRSDGLED